MAAASFRELVYRWVERIPSGRVLSYGDVAALCGSPRAARGVGTALRHLPEGSACPWWRVISASGRSTIGGHGSLLQRQLLEMEGVRFRSGKIDLSEFRWDPAGRGKRKRRKSEPDCD